jgi:hypothetical protein
VRRVALLAAALSAVGAACGPTRLRVETAPTVEAARLRTRVVDGAAATEPTECDMPCELVVPQSTDHELTIEAPGYHRAKFTVSSRVLFYAPEVGVHHHKLLRVPLRARPPLAVPRTSP